MSEEKEDIQASTRPTRPLDTFDRTILSALVRDARLTYAEIGNLVGLSVPAVHDRVKRMKASGVIAGTTTIIDCDAIGKSFLAFVHVDADGWGKSQRVMKLNAFPEVEEMHSVAGDACVIHKVRTKMQTRWSSFCPSSMYCRE